MPLVAFQTLLDRALRNCGFDPATAPQVLGDSFAQWLQERVLKMWVYSLWPQTLLIEQRRYADTWTATTYASGAVVWYAPGAAYYMANASTVGGDVPGTSTKWDAYAPPRWIPFAQTGQTIIGEPLNAWKDDPRLVRAPRPIGFWHDGVTVFLDTIAPTQVYLRFRKPAPQFSATAYDSAQAYAAGDVFLWTDRNCYLALSATTAGDTPTSAPAKFAVQQTPAIFAEYATRGVKADWYSDDGQDDKATAQELLAQGWLNDRLADLTILQGQTANYSARG